MAIMAGFLDLTRLLGRVMGSDLVLSICNTFADLYTVLWVTCTYNITPKMFKRSVNVTDSNPEMAMLEGFLDLTRLLGRVMGSDVFLSICNTCAGQYKVLWVSSRYNITPKTLKKPVKVTDSDQKWPCWQVFLT